MYSAMKKLIEKRFYANAEDAREKLDVFFAVDRLNSEQYAELTALIGEIYD